MNTEPIIEPNRYYTYVFDSKTKTIHIDWVRHTNKYIDLTTDITQMKFTKIGDLRFTMNSLKYDIYLFIHKVKESLNEFLSKYDNRRFRKKALEIESIIVGLDNMSYFLKAFKRAKEVLGYIDGFTNKEKTNIYPAYGYVNIRLKEKEIENETLQTRF